MRSLTPILFGLLALWACEDRAPARDTPGKPPKPAVAAVVDGEVILRKEIEDEVARRTNGRTVDAKEQRRLLRVTLDAQIEAILVNAALRRAGLQPSDGLEALLDRIKPLNVDPGAVERTYLLEYGDTKPLREARFSMILLRLPPDAGATAEDRSRRDLQRIRRRIEGSMTFEEAAKQYSQDPTREFEGQWEFIDLQKLEPSLRAAVEKAPTGEISDPIRTAEGWVLLRLDGRRTEMDTAVGSRKAEIHRRLITGRATERREKFLMRLLEEATVEIVEDLR